MTYGPPTAQPLYPTYPGPPPWLSFTSNDLRIETTENGWIVHSARKRNSKDEGEPDLHVTRTAVFSGAEDPEEIATGFCGFVKDTGRLQDEIRQRWGGGKYDVKTKKGETKEIEVFGMSKALDEDEEWEPPSYVPAQPIRRVFQFDQKDALLGWISECLPGNLPA